jgi:hypothetical protein
MSYTFTLSGTTSELTAYITPEINATDGDYVLGLTNFDTYYSIANIEKGRNKFYYEGGKPIEIPRGAYEIDGILQYLKNILQERNDDTYLDLNPNRNTLHTELKCTKSVDFTKEDSIGPLLGFKKKQKLSPNKLHISDETVNIMEVNSICVECNLTDGSYRNGNKSHIIHQFFPQVPPGYKIVESPTNVIYLPITAQIISKVSVKITNQDGEILDFGKEIITIRLHLKKI